MVINVTDGMAVDSSGLNGRKKGHPRHKGAGSTREELERRFWSKVAKTDGCWLWNARKLNEGYGMFRMGATMKVAHRVSYELCNGGIAKGMSVCHKCDNPSCVRPDHLFIGTHRDNMHDRWLKGGYTGCGGAVEKKLTVNDVREIRGVKVTRGTISKLARKFNVSRVTIRRVIARSSYKSVA